MLLLVAAATALSAPQDAPRAAPAAVVVQARATVRIVRAARIAFEGARDPDLPMPRKAQIRTADGPLPAQLIEFE